jgi:hyperosmotically inducible protein
LEVTETERSSASGSVAAPFPVGLPTAVLIAVLIALGCGTGTRPVDERVEDAVLASTVRQRLANDQRLSTTRIDVAVNSGIVTLTGRVPAESLRLRAETLARGVEGAREVRNLIRVHGRGE